MIDVIGPENVSLAVPGPRFDTICVNVRVVEAGSANRPTIDTSAISAGKSDRSP